MPFQYNKIYNKNKVLKIKMNFSNYIKLCTLALFITMGISRADASNESIFYDSYKLINEGKFEEAEKVLSNLQKLLPNNIEIFNNLAVIEAEKGNIEEAIKILTKSLSLNQNLNTIYSNLTNLYAYRANILYEQALDIENERKPLNLIAVDNLSKVKKTVVENKGITSQNKKEVSQSITLAEITDFTNKWAAAWQSKNIPEYLNLYKEGYYTNNIKSNSEWKKDRERKIKNKDKIVINLSNFKEIFSSSHSFLVAFTQSYESSKFKDTVIKHLLITKINNELKISGEFVIR